MKESATTDEIKAWDEKHDEPHPVFNVQHRPERTLVQEPIQRWLVLTEYGVELQPLGNFGLVQAFFEAVKPYRQKCSIVNENAYMRVYGQAPE